MESVMLAMGLKTPGGLDHVKELDCEPREPGPGELAVKVHASSLNYHDYAVAVGIIRAEDNRILLSDAAGEITAIGEGVSGWQVGDRVMSHFFPNWEAGTPSVARLTGVPGDHVDGFAAQQVTMSAAAFSAMPAHLDFHEAATLPCAALTAWRALMVETHLRPGDWVLVQGSGGVSVFALQLAKAMGCRVIATSSSAAKLERLRELGADATINYREEQAWGNRVLELTGGRGADLVVEVGGAGTVPQSIRAVAFGGCIAMIGVLTGISGDVPTAELFQKNARIAGITVGSHAHQADMVAGLEATGIRPVIDRVMPLAELADAFRVQESQQHFGKIVIDVAAGRG
jgi:NADPH:quinone reductase-like Zn-dependent oxidoreductase